MRIVLCTDPLKLIALLSIFMVVLEIGVRLPCSGPGASFSTVLFDLRIVCSLGLFLRLNFARGRRPVLYGKLQTGSYRSEIDMPECDLVTFDI